MHVPPAARRIRSIVKTGLANEAGFTLTELLAVLVILGIVIAGLTQLMLSASNSQIDQTKRTSAQQDGRVALDRVRRELHCASAVSVASASSVTATLGSYCPLVPSTTLNSAVTLPTATISVASTSKFNAGANSISFGSSGAVTCTGTTSTSFTGCSGGIAGTYSSGANVVSPVTWCATGALAPYSFRRYVGTSCSGSKVSTFADSLFSNAVFTLPAVAAPTLVYANDAAARLSAGTYAYVVTAATSAGEIGGTLNRITIPAGTTNKVTLSWTAYPGATSYNVYGREDVSSGIRLLGRTTSTTYTDVGPTSLSSTLTVPTSGAYSISVVSTTGYGSGANTISFGGSGNVTCTGTTATSFTGCTGGIPGSYAAGTVVKSISAQRPPLATLFVTLVLDETPADDAQRFTLRDAIALRNSRPF